MSDLFEQLEKYADSDYYPFHMPGHKRNVAGKCGSALEAAYGIDITEIDGFDNLHQAQGILQRAQQDAAKLYGAEETFFLVNGSTCGILSAIFAVTQRGDRLLAARNCHRSVYYAVYLQELQVSYLYPDVVKEYGIADAVTPGEVELLLKEQPDIAAVIITSPTYEGVISDIGKIADITHRYGKPLIVDEAHGAHFGFHEAFPENAVRQGADIVIHSVHKTLPAMTQTSLLHVSGKLVNRERLKRYLKVFQTSSPSYVLMASIDSCMNLMKREGRQLLEQLLNHRSSFAKEVAECRYLEIMDKKSAFGCCMRAMDPIKVVISIKNGELTGQQLYDILRERYHLQLEMAAGSYVLAMLSPMDGPDGLERLAGALLEIDGEITAAATDEQEESTLMPLETMMPIAKAIALSDEKGYDYIPVREAQGRTSAEFINLYPPGIPITVPGEKIDGSTVKAIDFYLRTGLCVQGVQDGMLKVLGSVNESKKNVE
ncbi:arginine/lysine/ornithine decarboxylase [Kineothrix alysoides]|uniref:Arginine/lysine/ornithine decarboxylase n=1 Tax=Kineothrix alysoides TaxID=1469948 RepID=A0A4R1QU16_9FIRM|nr:aminotransferase class I/II-fold pyridoxal phosphate-dependent enzyme [Kineothrix alysoides]TCL56997.1 arginine/lysine/ornithine decarboxylase [Kineothrix alysoides]